jgi:hypothetical protein
MMSECRDLIDLVRLGGNLIFEKVRLKEAVVREVDLVLIFCSLASLFRCKELCHLLFLPRSC